IRVPHHCAELESVKLACGAEDAPSVNDGPTIVKNDKQPDDDEDRKQQNDENPGTKQVHAPLDEILQVQVPRVAEMLGTGMTFQCTFGSEHKWVFPDAAAVTEPKEIIGRLENHSARENPPHLRHVCSQVLEPKQRPCQLR